MPVSNNSASSSPMNEEPSDHLERNLNGKAIRLEASSVETAPQKRLKTLAHDSPPLSLLPPSPRPAFDELPLHKTHPKASAWGLYGDDDELGTLNLLTPDVTKAAAAEIKLGRTIPLNLPLDSPTRPMNPARKKCCHRIVAKGYANDDELDINTQSSTHWDGLRHYPYQDSLKFYNGVTQEDISGPLSNSKIGVQNIARRGIATRGVLLDYRSWALRNKIRYSPFSTHEIPLSHLLAVAREEKVTFRRGDILIIRSGFTEEYNKLSLAEQDALGTREKEDRRFCGVQASEEMIRWHWEMGFAAVAGDTNAYEAWPPRKEWGVCLHEVLLSGWGMPIGEVWDLEELARACRQEKRWTFFLASQPLNLEAGVASPANVMAVL